MLRSLVNIQRKLIEEIKILFLEIDAHNIVPRWITSNKKIRNF